MQKIYNIIDHSRQSEEFSKLVSIRTGISIARIASRYAEMDLLTDDVLADIAFQTLLGSVTEHNIRWNEEKLKLMLRKSLSCK